MDKLRRVLSGREQDEESGGIMNDISNYSTLSWSTRIKGFAICFGIGLVLSVVGTVVIFFGQYTLFAVLFTFGNVLSILSTCFLMGPLNQLKKMFAPTRLIATLVMLCMFVLTFVMGFVVNSGGLALLCCLVQYLAMLWYSISYIPFARDAVTKCFQTCIN